MPQCPNCNCSFSIKRNSKKDAEFVGEFMKAYYNTLKHHIKYGTKDRNAALLALPGYNPTKGLKAFVVKTNNIDTLNAYIDSYLDSLSEPYVFKRVAIESNIPY